LAKDQLQDSVILHELVDRLFKISSRIGTISPTTRYSDIQGDMADNDEESSGHSDFRNDDEDEGPSGSGDGAWVDTDSSSPEPEVKQNGSSSFNNVTIRSLVLMLFLYFTSLH